MGVAADELRAAFHRRQVQVAAKYGGDWENWSWRAKVMDTAIPEEAYAPRYALMVELPVWSWYPAELVVDGYTACAAGPEPLLRFGQIFRVSQRGEFDGQELLVKMNSEIARGLQFAESRPAAVYGEGMRRCIRAVEEFRL